jgi:hypothetical protein
MGLLLVGRQAQARACVRRHLVVGQCIVYVGSRYTHWHAAKVDSDETVSVIVFDAFKMSTESCSALESDVPYASLACEYLT